MNPLERRNLLTDKINSLKSELDGADFMKKIDLKDEKDKIIFDALLEKSDILIENYRHLA